MAGNSAFQEFYLREIGVQTPFALHTNAPKLRATTPEHAETSAESPPVVPSPAVTLSITEPAMAAAGVVAAPQTAMLKTDLEKVAEEAANCTACPLSEQRKHVVFGCGNPQADIVFIGEAPGQDEDIQGEPFVGRAGQLLDRMLASLGMDRSQVYIMNTVKCRPPNNRDPKAEEVEACGKWFDAQLKALSPKLICLLGRTAAQTVLESDAPLSAMRGKWHTYHGIPVWVIYHPAYLLRSPRQKQLAWHDLLLLQQRYETLAKD